MPKARKKTAFVPSVVFGTVVVGVIPACVVSCGGSTVSPADASSDTTNADGVAATCFGPNSPSCPPCCGVAAVAYMGFDSGSDAPDAAADAPTDSPADAPQQDALPTVAAVGFCAFCDGGNEGGG